jgi:hypothetical protein
MDAVCKLPLRQQAVCVRLAAEANLAKWRAWCKRRGVKDLSAALLKCFDRWLDGKATNQQLNEIAERFQETLPADIAADPEPAGGYAGWAIRDIPMIALDQCEDVHEDILHTAICYAAAATCGIGAEAVWVDLKRLTRPELQFLSKCWERCCQEFPELAASEIR